MTKARGSEFYDQPGVFEHYQQHRDWPLNPVELWSAFGVITARPVLGSLGKRRRAGLGELVFIADSPERADARQIVGDRATDVMVPIADDDG